MNDNMIESLKNFISKDLNVISVKKVKEPFQFVRYGRKKFERITVCYELNQQEHIITLIKKKYPVMDMIMMMFKDENYREIKFFNSPIKKTFARFYDVPILFVDEAKKEIYLKDCSCELKRFGPPALPTEIQMKNLITRTAIKDAKFLNQQWEYANQFHDSFDFMYRALNNEFTEKELRYIGLEWPWFIKGFENLKKSIGNIRFEKLKTFFSSEKIKSTFSKVPFTLHHGDLFFANIGFNDENKPLVIDWELVTYAPIGYDFMVLINGIPPLQFTEMYEEWYISAFNNACDVPLTSKQFVKIIENLKDYYFLLTETIEYIRFSFSETEQEFSEKEAKQSSYIKRLDLILKLSAKKVQNN